LTILIYTTLSIILRLLASKAFIFFQKKTKQKKRHHAYSHSQNSKTLEMQKKQESNFDRAQTVHGFISNIFFFLKSRTKALFN
jgi:hypothetical protein